MSNKSHDNRGRFAAGSGAPPAKSMEQRLKEDRMKRDLRPAHEIARAYGTTTAKVHTIKKR